MNVGSFSFIGIDLTWRSDRNHTGAAVLRGDRGGTELTAVSYSIRTIAEVRAFIETHAGASTVIAIDAPLIIENATGQRPCETVVGKEYGGREASCHTSNLRLYPSPASVALVRELVAAGYVHAPSVGAVSTKVILEVYPHAGLIALFDLPKSLKYKKGTLAQKRQGLSALAEHLRRLTHATPVLRGNACLADILSRDLDSLGGAELKAHEDRLDALFCAYLAYYFWYWGLARNHVFGDLDTGYIANPKLFPGGIASHVA